MLVWGDPSLYDSSLRIVDRLRDDGLDIRVRVIPGITSLQALTAAHAIPLNRLGAPVLITTGRQVRGAGPRRPRRRRHRGGFVMRSWIEDIFAALCWLAALAGLTLWLAAVTP